MGLTPIMPGARKTLGIDDKIKGALILSVTATGSDAAHMGLSKGDVISKAGDHVVTTAADVAAAVGRREEGGPALRPLPGLARRPLGLRADQARRRK